MVLFRTTILVLAGITATAHHKPIDLVVNDNWVQKKPTTLADGFHTVS